MLGDTTALPTPIIPHKNHIQSNDKQLKHSNYRSLKNTLKFQLKNKKRRGPDDEGDSMRVEFYLHLKTFCIS